MSSLLAIVSPWSGDDESDIAVMPDIMDSDDMPLIRLTKLVLEPLSSALAVTPFDADVRRVTNNGVNTNDDASVDCRCARHRVTPDNGVNNAVTGPTSIGRRVW